MDNDTQVTVRPAMPDAARALYANAGGAQVYNIATQQALATLREGPRNLARVVSAYRGATRFLTPTAHGTGQLKVGSPFDDLAAARARAQGDLDKLAGEFEAALGQLAKAGMDVRTALDLGPDEPREADVPTLPGLVQRLYEVEQGLSAGLPRLKRAFEAARQSVGDDVVFGGTHASLPGWDDAEDIALPAANVPEPARSWVDDVGRSA
jgi:hypothetical protein